MNRKLSSLVAAAFGVLAFVIAIVSNHTGLNVLMIPALISATVSVFLLGKKEKKVDESESDC